MVKIYCGRPIDIVDIYDADRIYNREDCIKISYCRSEDDPYEIYITPEEALKISEILSDLSKNRIKQTQKGET